MQIELIKKLIKKATCENKTLNLSSLLIIDEIGSETKATPMDLINEPQKKSEKLDMEFINSLKGDRQYVEENSWIKNIKSIEDIDKSILNFLSDEDDLKAGTYLSKLVEFGGSNVLMSVPPRALISIYKFNADYSDDVSDDDANMIEADDTLDSSLHQSDAKFREGRDVEIVKKLLQHIPEFITEVDLSYNNFNSGWKIDDLVTLLSNMPNTVTSLNFSNNKLGLIKLENLKQLLDSLYVHGRKMTINLTSNGFPIHDKKQCAFLCDILISSKYQFILDPDLERFLQNHKKDPKIASDEKPESQPRISKNIHILHNHSSQQRPEITTTQNKILNLKI